MPAPEGLDRVLRDALGAEHEGATPPAGARERLIAELRRRRARRARAIGAGTAGLLLAAGLAATLDAVLTTPGVPARSATATIAPTDRIGSPTPSLASPGTGSVFAPSAAPQGASQPLAEAPCGELRVGSGPTSCVGSSTGPVTMRVGQHLSLELRGTAALRWSAPGVSSRGTVLEPSPGGTRVAGGSASATYVARRPGTALLHAAVAVGCADGTGRATACRAPTSRWSVLVIVEQR